MSTHHFPMRQSPAHAVVGPRNLSSTARATTEAAVWLTLTQAAEEYPALGRRYLQRLVAERRIPYYKPTGPRGRVLVQRADIEALITSSRREPVGAA